MSALGQKQTFAPQKAMSALPPKADMCGAARDVRFGPIADIDHMLIPERKKRPPANRHFRFAPNSDRESEIPQKTMSALPPKADIALDKYLARTDKIALAAIAKLERGVK